MSAHRRVSQPMRSMTAHSVNYNQRMQAQAEHQRRASLQQHQAQQRQFYQPPQAPAARSVVAIPARPIPVAAIPAVSAPVVTKAIPAAETAVVAPPERRRSLFNLFSGGDETKEEKKECETKAAAVPVAARVSAPANKIKASQLDASEIQLDVSVDIPHTPQFNEAVMNQLRERLPDSTYKVVPTADISTVVDTVVAIFPTFNVTDQLDMLIHTMQMVFLIKSLKSRLDDSRYVMIAKVLVTEILKAVIEQAYLLARRRVPKSVAEFIGITSMQYFDHHYLLVRDGKIDLGSLNKRRQKKSLNKKRKTISFLPSCACGGGSD